MRRRLAPLLLIPALLLPTACGGGGDKGTDTADQLAASPGEPAISAGVKFGEEPTLKPDGKPPAELTFKVLQPGTGKEVKKGDVLVADFKGQVWDPGGVQLQPFEDSFTTVPMVRPIGVGGIIPAWDDHIPGQKVGARVMLVAPPKDAFGLQGNQSAGILGNDTLIFVIDILDTLDPKAGASGTAVAPGKGQPTVTGATDPKITVPKGAPPTTLVNQVLIQGKGEPVKSGQLLAVHYTGLLWKNGKQFDSSWDRKGGPVPFSFRLGDQGVIDGWQKGLVGQRIGSRVLLVIPPAEGYGTAGNTAAGISATDTLVFAVDILGAY